MQKRFFIMFILKENYEEHLFVVHSDYIITINMEKYIVISVSLKLYYLHTKITFFILKKIMKHTFLRSLALILQLMGFWGNYRRL